jgi:hypothetical protein
MPRWIKEGTATFNGNYFGMEGYPSKLETTQLLRNSKIIEDLYLMI